MPLKRSANAAAWVLAWASVSAPALGADAPATAPAAATAAPIALAPVPERAQQQFAQALALMKSGKTVDAELELKQLILSYPDLPGPQINLGILMARASHWPEAHAAFKAALALNPGSAVANSELGIVDRRLGKFADAEQDYQRAIAADAAYAPARLNLGILYDLYLLQPQKALEQYEQFLSLVGDNKAVIGWVAELKKRLGILTPAPAKPAPAPEPAPVPVPSPAAKKEPA